MASFSLVTNTETRNTVSAPSSSLAAASRYGSCNHLGGFPDWGGSVQLEFHKQRLQDLMA